MADKARNEIVLADNSGRVTRRFGATGTEPGKFRCPAAVCADSQENIYVCDGGDRAGPEETSTATVSRSRLPEPCPAPGDP